MYLPHSLSSLLLVVLQGLLYSYLLIFFQWFPTIGLCLALPFPFFGSCSHSNSSFLSLIAMRPLRLLVGSMHVTNWNSLVPQAAYEEGNPVSGHGATEICRIAQSIWAYLASIGKVLKMWVKIDIIAGQQYRCELAWLL